MPLLQHPESGSPASGFRGRPKNIDMSFVEEHHISFREAVEKVRRGPSSYKAPLSSRLLRTDGLILCGLVQLGREDLFLRSLAIS